MIKTLKGYSEEEVYRLLAHPLPRQCYKWTEGTGVRLTDVSSVARDVVINRVLGVCGVGWKYAYDRVDIETFTNKKGTEGYRAIVHKLEVCVKWVREDGTEFWSEPLPMAHSNVNYVDAGYAAKGALTSAISAAFSHLGWQQAVYQGALTPDNVDAAYQKYGPHPLEADIVRAGLEPVAPKAVDTKAEAEQPKMQNLPAAPAAQTAPVEVAADKPQQPQIAVVTDNPLPAEKAEALYHMYTLLEKLGYAGGEAAENAIRSRGLDPGTLESSDEQIAELAARLAGEAKIYDLLSHLGREGDIARQALKSRGYNPDSLTQTQINAIIPRLEGQLPKAA